LEERKEKRAILKYYCTFFFNGEEHSRRPSTITAAI